MRNNSNVAALVFIGAPVYIICRYVALAFGYAVQRLVVCFPVRVYQTPKLTLQFFSVWLFCKSLWLMCFFEM